MSYNEQFKEFKNWILKNDPSINDQFLEFKFEALKAHLGHEEIELVKKWYNEKVDNCQVKVEKVNLNALKGWKFDSSSGDIKHESGEFFKVEGYRTSNCADRESQTGWDQPFLTQQGYDGGILGLIRQRSENGVPRYLVEAKFEPGNYNFIQISPTVQATMSNIKKAHGGRDVNYVEFFLERNSSSKVIIEQWASEDGGRLFNKRNKIMMIDVSEPIVIKSNFKWVTLYTLKELIRNEEAIVSPHIRAIISGL